MSTTKMHYSLRKINSVLPNKNIATLIFAGDKQLFNQSQRNANTPTAMLKMNSSINSPSMRAICATASRVALCSVRFVVHGAPVCGVLTVFAAAKQSNANQECQSHIYTENFGVCSAFYAPSPLVSCIYRHQHKTHTKHHNTQPEQNRIQLLPDRESILALERAMLRKHNKRAVLEVREREHDSD